MIYRLLLPKQTLGSHDSGIRDFQRNTVLTFNGPLNLTPLQLRYQYPPWTWPRCNIFLVNRQIFTEMHPLLYSQHLFHMLACLAALRFFRQIGQLNREALREIRIQYRYKMPPSLLQPDVSYEVLRRKNESTFALSCFECTSPRCGANLFNVLAKCTNAAILIDTTVRTLALLDGSTQYPAFANMHGFKKATTTLTRKSRSDDWPRPRAFHTRCRHQDAAERAILQRLDNGAKRMESPCPKGCSVHKECTSRTTTATIHLEVECDICWECAHNDFLSVWVEKKGCIFGLQQ